MKKVILFIVLTSCILTTSFGQKNQDFILTLRKDTIFGKISISPEDQHITFKHKRKRVYFHPKTLQAFGVKEKKGGYKMYKSITNLKGRSMFVEILDEGPVKLYKYNKSEEVAKTKYRKNLYYIGLSDETLSTLTPETYTLTMKVLLKDHPSLLAKAEKISYNQVPDLVASYNQQ